MGVWDDLNKGLKSNPITRVFSAAGEAVYNVVPKSENLAIGTYENGTTTTTPAPEDPKPNTGGNPLTDWIPGWDSSKGVTDNITGGLADNTVEKIPGWDSSKGVTANVTGGIVDVFTNAGKAVTELGSTLGSGVKKYLPLAAAGAVALLLLRK